MFDEVKQAIYIGIELIVFSIFLFLVFLLIVYSKNAVINKEFEDNSRIIVEQYKNVYELTSGKILEYSEIKETLKLDESFERDENGGYRGILTLIDNLKIGKTKEGYFEIVTGDDIVKFISTYPYMYDIVVYPKKEDIESNDKGAKPLISLITKNSEQKWIKKGLKTEDVDGWEIKTISEKLKEKLNSEFYCVGIYDTPYNEYDSILFIEKEK